MEQFENRVGRGRVNSEDLQKTRGHYSNTNDWGTSVHGTYKPLTSQA